MKNYSLLVYLSIILLNSCKHDEPNLDAGQAVSGTFTAKSTESFGESKLYPINGKTITLQIERVSADTVRVRVQAPANGFYSPAKDTTYAKAYVLTKPQGYYISLEPPVHPGTAENQITVSSGSALYTFIPPSYTLGAVTTVFTKAN
ncbi:hypothetical protein [Spirosoma radiotolerans]|uniref:Uncharacterized protein n=1 Tax=Spirosoma radiotolerans TaxID=1379870 RepID=A0A0E3ZRY4_9BACT|nr:hypothetical protein [Spirosoma radiotolerans]AKD53860.1 hypothetical protein SD10_02010 [Spirosoma radiotolerans]